MIETFDPDKFLLDKKMIIRVMNAIGNRWGKSKIAKFKNAKYIVGLEAMKAGVLLSSEDVIREVWRDILIGFNELIYLNQMSRLRGEYPSMEKMLDLVVKKIETGELFDSKNR